MKEWLINDLINANNNRKKVPWIVIFGHKPIYCYDDFECPNYYELYNEIENNIKNTEDI